MMRMMMMMMMNKKRKERKKKCISQQKHLLVVVAERLGKTAFEGCTCVLRMSHTGQEHLQSNGGHVVVVGGDVVVVGGDVVVVGGDVAVVGVVQSFHDSFDAGGIELEKLGQQHLREER